MTEQPSSAPVGGFTPRDEISDWSIATSHELVRARLDTNPALAQMLDSIRDTQAAWEVLITVARSAASILRPDGNLVPGPIGDRNTAVYGIVARMTLWRSLDDVEAVVTTAGRLLGCAAADDYVMCRALAAVVVSHPDNLGQARLVLRAMLEILAIEPQQPRPQEPTS